MILAFDSQWVGDIIQYDDGTRGSLWEYVANRGWDGFFLDVGGVVLALDVSLAYTYVSVVYSDSLFSLFWELL